MNALPHNSTRRPAFSLVELALVMAIITILSAIALPRYGAALDRYRADSAARRLVGDVALVQAEARSASAARVLTFNVNQNRYTVSHDVDDPPYRTVDLTEPPYHARLQAVALGASSGATLTFNGHGMPDVGGTIVIHVGSQVRTVTVSSYTGKASF